MKNTKYLYGDKLDRAVIEAQKSIAKAKIAACNQLIDELQQEPLATRDDQRIEDVIKARSFNEKLLNEEL